MLKSEHIYHDFYRKLVALDAERKTDASPEFIKMVKDIMGRLRVMESALDGIEALSRSGIINAENAKDYCDQGLRGKPWEF